MFTNYTAVFVNKTFIFNLIGSKIVSKLLFSSQTLLTSLSQVIPLETFQCRGAEWKSCPRYRRQIGSKKLSAYFGFMDEPFEPLSCFPFQSGRKSVIFHISRFSISTLASLWMFSTSFSTSALCQFCLSSQWSQCKERLKSWRSPLLLSPIYKSDCEVELSPQAVLIIWWTFNL